MAIDYGAKEREFLDSLESDTGRTLAAWMAAIDAAGLSERQADAIQRMTERGILWGDYVGHRLIAAMEADAS